MDPKSEDRGDELDSQDLDNDSTDIEEGSLDAADAADAGEDESQDSKDAESEDTKASKDNRQIPRSRYNAKAEQLKAAEAEIAKLRKQMDEATAKPTEKKDSAHEDLDKAYAAQFKAYKAALEDDNDDAALAANRAMADIQAQMVEERLSARISDPSDIKRQALEEIKWEEAVKDVENRWPVLNQDSDDYEPDLAREVRSLAEDFLATGKRTMAESVLRAARYVMLDAGINEVGGETKKTSGSKKAAKLAHDISKAGETGHESPVRVQDLSEDEWSALPDSKKRELRGDTL